MKKPSTPSPTKVSGKPDKLPKNFSEQVLELELMLDREGFTMDDLNKLLKLYSVRIG